MSERRVVLDLPAGPIRVGVTAAQADTEWLEGEEPEPGDTVIELRDGVPYIGTE